MNKKKFGRPACCIRTDEGNSLYVTKFSPDSSHVQKRDEIVLQYKLQKTKMESLVAQKHAKANIDYILLELENIKNEILSLKKAIQDLENIISSSLCKTKHPTKLSDLCKVKTCLRIDLANVIHMQIDLTKQLKEARLVYRNIKIDDQILTEDLHKLKNNRYKPVVQTDAMVKKRIERELQSNENARRTRDVTIQSVANSITTHCIQTPNPFTTAKQLREARVARQSVDKYIAKTIRSMRETKAIAMTEQELLQRRQRENLSKLKHTINEIKNTLTVKNKLKRIQDEEIALEKEEVRNLLIAQGANPYLAEYLLAIQEKQREFQRKMLVDEQKRLLNMQREYAVVEAAKVKEEIERKKWDTFWSNKVKDKVARDKEEKMEMYYDIVNDEDEERESIETFGETLENYRNSVIKDEANNSQVVETVEANESDTSEPKMQKAKLSVGSGSAKKKSTSSDARGSINSNKSPRGSKDITNPVVSTRRPLHLDYIQKESLLGMAGDNYLSTTITLMSKSNNFDFGGVVIGERNYVFVDVANISLDTVKLKMSVVNPYGPFTFCNALKDIPSDNFYTLKFKFSPVDPIQSEEIIKIEEVGHSEHFILIRLIGTGNLIVQ